MECEFKNNIQIKKGKISYPDGGVYKGDIRNSEKHGKGTYTYPNGDEYIGEFKDNMFHGLGKWVKSTGEVKIGLWEYGTFKEEQKIDLMGDQSVVKCAKDGS